MSKLVIEAIPEIHTEDGGQAMILEICPNDAVQNGEFVRLQSWDSNLKHQVATKFVGKKVRVTIETI